MSHPAPETSIEPINLQSALCTERVKTTGEFIYFMNISQELGLSMVLHKSALVDSAYIRKNNMQMCLYKQNKFIDFFSHGYMVLNTIMSSNGVYVAYINCIYDEPQSQDYIELLVYKFNTHGGEVNLHYTIKITRDICEDPALANYYLCFSLDNKYLIFKAEWNHIYIINIETIERIEFFIPNDRKNNNNQVIHVCTTDDTESLTQCNDGTGNTDLNSSIKNYVIWYGYDEYIRIIELNFSGKQSPIMWRDKLIHTITNYQLQTRYFIPLPGNYLLYMDKYNKVTMMKINFKTQRFDFVYDIVYPAIGYDDIKLNADTVLFLNDKFTCTINLTEKSCRVTKNNLLVC